MEITLPGIVLIPIGLLLLFSSSKYLYYSTIFFIPFSATSLLNSASGAPLLAVQYFGSLLILKEFLFKIGVPKSTWNISPAMKMAILYMFLFMMVAIVSMVMPYLINGSISVYDNKFPDLEEAQVFLTSQNFKNPLPVIFGMLLAYVIIKRNRSLAKLEISAKIFIASIVFVTAWGLMQLSFNPVDNEFPSNLFNTAIHQSVAKVSGKIDVGAEEQLRVTSVTLEPSLVSQALLSAIPLFLVFFASGGKVFSHVLDRIIFSCMVFLLLVSTSTTAYVGFGIVFILFFWISRHIRMRSTKKIIMLAVVALLSLLIFFFLSSGMRYYLGVVLFNKSDSISALARVYSVTTAWGYFLQYPILGLGWGIVTSNDLVVCILANSGIIGFFVFAKLVMIIFKESLSNLRYRKGKNLHSAENITRWLAGFVLSFSTYLSVSAFTSFTYYLPLFYFLVGILIAFNSVFHSKEFINYSTNQ